MILKYIIIDQYFNAFPLAIRLDIAIEDKGYKLKSTMGKK